MDKIIQETMDDINKYVILTPKERAFIKARVELTCIQAKRVGAEEIMQSTLATLGKEKIKHAG